MATIAEIRPFVSKTFEPEGQIGEVTICHKLLPPAVSQLNEVNVMLTTGGDDRSLLDETGHNKYHCRPVYDDNDICRGSCTCNSPSRLGLEAATAAFEAMKKDPCGHTASGLFSDVRSQIAELLHLPKSTGVFLTPSGTDAEYLPLCFMKALHGEGKTVNNIVTCLEEVGSGTFEAAGGFSFSSTQPIAQSGGSSSKSATSATSLPLPGLAQNVRTVGIPARNKDGSVVDLEAELDRLKMNAAMNANDETLILHTVYGSKTGIIQDCPKKVLDHIKQCQGLHVLDACQGRIEVEAILKYLEQGTVVLFTCSKFYRSPPFAGAVLVPPALMVQLAQSNFVPPSSLKGFFTQSQVPESLPRWRAALASTSENHGLALRWVAGLAEMKATLKVDEFARQEATACWRKAIIEAVSKHPRLRHFSEAEGCHGFQVSQSIVSVTLHKSDKNGTNITNNAMTKAELSKVFQAMTEDMSTICDHPAAAKRCFIGQPVTINASQGVLRIALGSDSLRRFIEDPASVLKDDCLLIEKMSMMAEEFHSL